MRDGKGGRSVNRLRLLINGIAGLFFFLTEKIKMCSLFVVGWGVGTARHQQLLCALGASHESRLSGNEWSAPLVLFGEMMS